MLLLILRLKRTADEIYPLPVLTSEADFVCRAAARGNHFTERFSAFCPEFLPLIKLCE